MRGRLRLAARDRVSRGACDRAASRASQAANSLLVDGQDEDVINRLEPIVDGKLKADTTRRAQLAHAAYALGVARYHLSMKAGSPVSLRLRAVGYLRTYFEAEAELTAAGEEVREPLLGRALGRFYLGHILYNGGDLPKAKDALTEYLADVAAAGPQRVLNMPDGFLGKKINEVERKASRFKSRASSGEAQADAHTMLAMCSEHLDGAEGLRTTALPHLQAQRGVKVVCVVVVVWGGRTACVRAFVGVST